MIGSLVGPGWSVFEKTKWFREAGLDTNTIKRLIVTECRKNLALLGPLKLEDSSVSQNAPAIVAVASRIQYDAIEVLLALDDKANKAFRELAEIPFEPAQVENCESESEVDESKV
jgi:hypothetical protein